MIIRCHVCNADPAGRWKQPPAMIFIDSYQADGSAGDGPVYACRGDVSPEKELAIQAQEKSRGWPVGGTR